MARRESHRVYWFMYENFCLAWNNFKDFIGHPKDPWWITWIVNHIPGYYPGDEWDGWG